MNKLAVFQRKNDINTVNLGSKVRKIESLIVERFAGLRFVCADVGNANVTVTLTFKNSVIIDKLTQKLIGHIVNDTLNGHVPFGHMYTAGDD